MRPLSRFLILGATSIVVPYLLARLAQAATPVLVAGRRHPSSLPDSATFLDFASLSAPGWHMPDDTVAISLLPLPVLPALLPHLAGARCLVALGSTSRFSKAQSSSPDERRAADRLAEAEAQLQSWSATSRTPVTLLRPTLVYDLVHDRNLARMARFIARFRILPVAAPASGLRQPIHIDDVGKAILGAVTDPGDAYRAFNIAGGEILTYREMVERVFAALGHKARVLPLPVKLLRRAFAMAKGTGLLREAAFGSSVFDRMNQDLVFDVADGLVALRYDPRPFVLDAEPRPGDLDSRSVQRPPSAPVPAKAR